MLGNSVTIVNPIIRTKTKGITCFISGANGTLQILAETKSVKATGGVINPIARLETINTP